MEFETSEPNEAMCVSGCGYSKPNLISGGRVWIWPVVQDSFYYQQFAITSECNHCNLNIVETTMSIQQSQVDMVTH